MLTVLPLVMIERIGEFLELASLFRFAISSKQTSMSDHVFIEALELFPILKDAIKICPYLSAKKLLSKHLMALRKRTPAQVEKYITLTSLDMYIFIWQLSSLEGIMLATGVSEISDSFWETLSNETSRAVNAKNSGYLTLQVIDKSNGKLAELCHLKFEIEPSRVQDVYFEDGIRSEESVVQRKGEEPLNLRRSYLVHSLYEEDSRFMALRCLVCMNYFIRKEVIEVNVRIISGDDDPYCYAGSSGILQYLERKADFL